MKASASLIVAFTLLLAGALLLGSSVRLRTQVAHAVRLARGNAAYSVGSNGEAEVWFRKALGTNTAQYTAQYNLGNALYQQGRYAEATRCYKLALPACPLSLQAQVWANIGNACYQAGRVPDSYAAYRHALLLRPADNAIRQDFLFVQERLAAKQKDPHSPPKDTPAPTNRNAQQQAESQSEGTGSKQPPAQEAPAQQLSEKNMQELFGTITQDESRLRSKLTGPRHKGRKAASDEKDY